MRSGIIMIGTCACFKAKDLTESCQLIGSELWLTLLGRLVSENQLYLNSEWEPRSKERERERKREEVWENRYWERRGDAWEDHRHDFVAAVLLMLLRRNYAQCKIIMVTVKVTAEGRPRLHLWMRREINCSILLWRLHDVRIICRWWLLLTIEMQT